MPTILGKNYFNFQTIVDEFLEAQAVEVVENVQQAATTLLKILNDSSKAESLNTAAQKIMQQNQGSLAKHIAVIDQYL